MAIQPDTDVQTSSKGGWLRGLRNLVKLAFGSRDDELILENKTKIAWRVYHDYHMLGIIDPNEKQKLKIEKRGTLNVRPMEGEEVEYLVLSLDSGVHRVRIYQRRMAKNVEVYDMHAA